MTDRSLRAAGTQLLLKQQAYAALKRNIIEGRFAAGSFLSERRLVELLGMSKTPIRSALERLEAEGYVSVSPRQGIAVREPSLGEIIDQFELRLAIEGYVLEALAGRLNAEQVDRLESNLRAQRESVTQLNLARHIELDGQFHLLFCEFLGNREILRVMTQLGEKFSRIAWLVFRKAPGRMQPSSEEHASIAEAVIQGRLPEALELLKKHMDQGKRALVHAS